MQQSMRSASPPKTLSTRKPAAAGWTDLKPCDIIRIKSLTDSAALQGTLLQSHMLTFVTLAIVCFLYA